MADLQQILATLLGGDKSAPQEIPMRLVRKNGRPFLLLPWNSRLAAETLALYPAQSLRARVARQGLRTALSAGLSVGTEKISLSLSNTNSFVRFLASCHGGSDSALPPFGVLAGNPAAPGQRFVFLVFNSAGKPAIVVKAGITDDAKKLIRREREFLTNAPNLSSVPRLRNTFESSEAEALAVDFVAGRSPAAKDEPQIPRVLTSWVLPDQKVSISKTRVWRELETAAASQPLFREFSKKLATASVSASIFHGDFAPWNIKVSPSDEWAVFDWERGDTAGVPGYDWFHYVIQTRLLVAHAPTDSVVRQLDSLIASKDFQTYSAKARISGIERELAVFYLLHHNEVIRPAEGLKEGNELISALAAAG